MSDKELKEKILSVYESEDSLLCLKDIGVTKEEFSRLLNDDLFSEEIDKISEKKKDIIEYLIQGIVMKELRSMLSGKYPVNPSLLKFFIERELQTSSSNKSVTFTDFEDLEYVHEDREEDR